MDTPKAKGQRRVAAFVGVFFALLIAVSFVRIGYAKGSCTPFTDACLTPVTADDPLPARLAGYFVKGADFYWQHIIRWLGLARARLPVVSPSAIPHTGECDQVADCPAGQACLNACTDDACRAYTKKCQPHGAGSIEVPQAYAPCSASNICAPGTLCTSTCPAGVQCDIQFRCIPVDGNLGSCSADEECTDVCARNGFPSSGLFGLRAACRDGACGCAVVEIDPKRARASCAGTSEKDPTLLCPISTTDACTEDGVGRLRHTCLLAPAYGGQCIVDAHCSDVDCPPDTDGFCGEGSRCHCRSSSSEAVRCSADTDCAIISCESDETKVCTSNGCACARTENREIACTSDAMCPANCASGFEPACITGSCACRQRPTTEIKPVACQTVSDCNAVSCPAGYDKACQQSTCVCTRTIEQQ